MAASGTRVAVVTGASAGIGRHTALGLPRSGMRVVLVGRNPERTEAARRFVADRVPGAKLDTVLADFASLDSVRALAAEVLALCKRIDVLVNNAGLISPRYAVSGDGYEITVAVNH